MNNLTMLRSLFYTPRISEGYKNVWYRNYLHFKKTFLVSFFWIILEPLMYLGGIGFGLGSYVNTINGLTYIDYFFPGLLCSTAMMVPFFEGTYTNYTKLNYQKIYTHMLLTRMDANEIGLGEMLWCMSKGLFSVLGLSLIASLFGLIQDWKFLLVILVLIITSWIFSCLAIITTSMAKNYDSFIYATSGFLIPMTLISGIYFPIENMPFVMQIISYTLPLSHSVQLCRGLLSNHLWNWSMCLHAGYLVCTSYVLLNYALKRWNQKLIK